MSRKRRNHLPVFKAKVALSAIKGDKTLADLPNSLMSTKIKSKTGKSNDLIRLHRYLEAAKTKSGSMSLI